MQAWPLQVQLKVLQVQVKALQVQVWSHTGADLKGAGEGITKVQVLIYKCVPLAGAHEVLATVHAGVVPCSVALTGTAPSSPRCR